MTAYTHLQTHLQSEPHTWLVTGVAGFIGSNLLATLLRRIAEWQTNISGFLSMLAVAHGVKIDTQPVCRKFRPGEVRHSLADISKIATRLGYACTKRIGQGLALAKPWYFENVKLLAI